jgi:hypothetical protein
MFSIDLKNWKPLAKIADRTPIISTGFNFFILLKKCFSTQNNPPARLIHGSLLFLSK